MVQTVPLVQTGTEPAVSSQPTPAAEAPPSAEPQRTTDPADVPPALPPVEDRPGPVDVET